MKLKKVGLMVVGLCMAVSCYGGLTKSDKEEIMVELEAMNGIDQFSGDAFKILMEAKDRQIAEMATEIAELKAQRDHALHAIEGLTTCDEDLHAALDRCMHEVRSIIDKTAPNECNKYCEDQLDAFKIVKELRDGSKETSFEACAYEEDKGSLRSCIRAQQKSFLERAQAEEERLLSEIKCTKCVP